MRHIPTIDTMMGLTVPGARGELSEVQASRTASMPHMIVEGWIRDDASTRYTHPAQHFFKDSGDRIGATETVEDLLALMDEVGIERGLVDCDLDEPERVLDIILAQLPLP